MPRIIAFVQARMSSQRLPGKVVRPLLNKPIFEHIFDQLKLIGNLSQSILLTSSEISDIPLCDLATSSGITYYCGDLNNVALRFLSAIKEYQPEYFVRINADSPLYHRHLVEESINLLTRHPSSNFITNVNPRSFPRGFGVELIKSDLFVESYRHFADPNDFEHVTPYFYRNQQNCEMINLKNNEDLSDLHLAVDTEEDFRRVDFIFEQMNKKPIEYDWQEYCDHFKLHYKETC